MASHVPGSFAGPPNPDSRRAAPCVGQPRTSTFLPRPLSRLMAPLYSVVNTWYAHMQRTFGMTRSLSRPVQPLPPPAAVLPAYIPNPDIIEISRERMARIQMQAAERDRKIHTESLLNVALTTEVPPQEQPAASLQNLSNLMQWYQTTLSGYATLFGLDHTPEKQQAIMQWEASYDALRRACEADQNDTAYLTHATSCYQALCRLPTQEPGTLVRYSGAFGKKQGLIQNLLAALPLTDCLNHPLPPFLLHAIQQNAMASPESLLSHGLDVILNYFFEKNPTLAFSEEFESALQFLKLLLPDTNRHYPLWDSIKSKIPNWLHGKGDDPIQQGLLSCLLDLIPDTHADLRDQCLDLLDKFNEGVRAEDRKAYILQWKSILMQKTLSALPLDTIEAFNTGMEATFSSLLQGINPQLATIVSGQCISYGTYWLEWSYDHKKGTYSLKIYASGSALTEKPYPHHGGRPLWPITLHNISLNVYSHAPPILTLLKAMSGTTALSKGWQQPTEDFIPLTSSDLFGKAGLVQQLIGMGACIDASSPTIPPATATFNQMDMVARFHEPTHEPSRTRYNALRQQLLKACKPFAVPPAPGEPPRLVIPRTEEGAATLQLFQSATATLTQAAKNEDVAPQEWNELTAFAEQLNQASKERQPIQAPQISEEQTNAEKALGLLVDQLLQGLCQSKGQTHLLVEYRDLLIFVLGEGSETVVDRLCEKAARLQDEVPDEPQDLPPQAAEPIPSAAAPAEAAVPHRAKGWIGRGLDDPTLRIFWWIIRFVHKLKGLTSIGWIGFLPDVFGVISPKFLSLKKYTSHGWASLLPHAIRVIAPKIIPQAVQTDLSRLYNALYKCVFDAVRELLFYLLFPNLKHTHFFETLHKMLRPIIASTGAKVPCGPIILPQPDQNDIFNQLDRTELAPHIDAAPKVAFIKHGEEMDEEGDLHTRMRRAEASLKHHVYQTVSRLENLVKAQSSLASMQQGEFPPLTVESHFWFKAQEACERALTTRITHDNQGKAILSLPNLTLVLKDWFILCQDLPNLLIHYIYKLPLFPDSQKFTLSFTGGEPQSDKNEADDEIERATKPIFDCNGQFLVRSNRSTKDEIENAIKYLFLCGNILLSHFDLYSKLQSGFPIPFRDYQLAQHQILALIDLLHRQLTHVPPRLNQARVDPLLQELSVSWRNSSDRTLYGEQQEHITQLLRYFYPKTPSLETLNHSHLAMEEGFLGKTINDMPVYAIYDTLTTLYLSQTSFSLSPDELRKWIILLNSDPRPHIPEECATSFLQLQMLQCIGYYDLMNPTTGYYPNLSPSEHRKPNSIDIGASETSKKRVSQTEHFWGQVGVDIHVGPNTSILEEPLTAPSRALRLIEHNPQFAVRHLSEIWMLLFSIGRIEVDWKENPALIHNYAQGAHVLLKATHETSHLQAFELALALRNRAWNIDPDTQAFAFLEDFVDLLPQKANSEQDLHKRLFLQWSTYALKALYRDHPKPLTLSPDTQQATIHLILSLLEASKGRSLYLGIEQGFHFYPKLYYYRSHLQQMALRWAPCMHAHRLTPIPHAVPPNMLPPQPVEPIQRQIGNTRYTLVHFSISAQLLRTLSNHFPWISMLKEPKAQCWRHGDVKNPIDGSRATILVTYAEQEENEAPKNTQQCFFVLEAHQQAYRLLGMVDASSKQIVYPAPAHEAAEWLGTQLAAWAPFCPISSMQLLVNRETSRPMYCHMTPFDLTFSLIETAEGWRGENRERFPGFWVAKEQTVPFGLLLENQEGDKQLLLPGSTLLHQALYAQLDPLIGILGNYVQRQEFLHMKDGKFHCYHLVKTPYLKDRWVSQDPYAMVHLLLFYFAAQKKEEMYQAGNALLQMPLPQNIEMELLPLQLHPDPQARQLYARLLAHLEISLLSAPPEGPPGLIGKYIPPAVAQLISCATGYRLLATQEVSDGLSDATVHHLFGRYCRLVHANEEHWIAFLKYKPIRQLLNTDFLALNLLPSSTKARIQSLEARIGNGPTLIERGVNVLSGWYQIPTPAFLDNPIAKQSLLNQSLLLRTLTPIGHMMRPDWGGRIIRSFPGLFSKHRDLLSLNMASGLLLEQMHLEILPEMQPESLSQATLIPYFFTYHAMARGNLGTSKQTRLTEHLYAQSWLTQGNQKALIHILLTVAAHPYQYALFRRLRLTVKSFPACIKSKRVRKKPRSPKQVAGQQRLEELHTLIRFEELQPKWAATQTVAMTVLCMISTFYMLSTVSDGVIQATSSTVIPIAQRVIPTHFALSTAAGMLHGTALQRQCASVTQAGSKAFTALVPIHQVKSYVSQRMPLIRCTHLRKVSNSLSGVAYMMLSLFSIHYFKAYMQYAALPPVFHNTTVLPSQQAADPAQFDLCTATTILIGLIPMLKQLYNMCTLLYVAKRSCAPLSTRNVLLLNPPASPCIPAPCRHSLHAEDGRWKNVLDQLFNEHFETRTLQRHPVRMRSLASERIQTSLTHYAQSNPSATSRTVFFLRSIDTLKRLRQQVDTLLEDRNHLQCEELRALFQAFGIAQEDRGMAMESLRHFFAVQDDHALKAYHITEQDKMRLKSILPPFFLRETEKQQLQKIAKALQKLQTLNPEADQETWDTACQQLITHLRARRMYDISALPPNRLALYLAFESSTETLLWKSQIDTVSAVLDAHGHSVAYELLMSLGKTFFAIPTIALSQADGTRVVFLVWPESMYRTQTRETAEQILRLSGRSVTPLSIDRSFVLTPERLGLLLRLFEGTKSDRGAISIRKRDLQSLELLAITRLETLQNKRLLTPSENAQIAKLQKLLVIVQNDATLVCDEIHALFEDVVLHFPIGPKEKIDIHAAHGVRKTLKALFKGPLGQILRRHTSLEPQAGAQEIFKQERIAVAHKMVRKICGDIPRRRAKGLIKYLLHANKATPQWLKESPKMLSALDSVRGVLLDIFPLFFTRSVGGDFGLSKQDPSLPYVIPYEGNDNPAEHKRLADPHEALAKTLVYHWHHGLTLENFQALLKACDANSRKWAEKKQRPYAEAPDARAFAALFPEGSPHTLQSVMQKIYQPEALEEIFNPLQRSLKLLMLYSRCHVEPSLEYQEEQCSSSAYDFAKMGQCQIAGTGTAYNAAVYPLEMRRQLDNTALGEAIVHIKKKCPPNGIAALTHDRPHEVLQEVIDRYFLSDIEATALMDGDGLLTGIPHTEVASCMLDAVRRRRHNMMVVDYFTIDPQTGETLCMSLIHGATHPVPMHTCKVPLEQRIAYFDEAHCFAANIPQPLKGKGVLLVGTGNPLYQGTQAAFRMRGLKEYTQFLGLLSHSRAMRQAVEQLPEKDLQNTQTLYIALAPQVGDTLRTRYGFPHTLEHVFSYMESEQQTKMEKVHLRGGLLMLDSVLRHTCKKAMLAAPSVSAFRKHFRASRSVLLTQMPQHASHLYGGARRIVPGTKIIEARYNQACDVIRKHPLLSSEERAHAERELKSLYLYLKELPLPREVSVRINEKGAYDSEYREQAMEISADQAKEEARERELAEETERELAQQLLLNNPSKLTPYPCVPAPWSESCPLDSTQWQWIDQTLKENHGILSALKKSAKWIGKFLIEANRRMYGQSPIQREPEKPIYTPPLFKLKTVLENASEEVLTDFGFLIDDRIWLSNHLLPQAHLSFTQEPAQPATGRQRLITHLLIEVKPQSEGVPAQILSVGALGPTDGNYWIKRLQSEHHNARQHPEQRSERLFFIYQMPVIENLASEHYDGMVIAFNQDSHWNPKDSTDFQFLEVMIKLFNGDHRYTEKQCSLLREWKATCRSMGKNQTLDQAFTLFYTMAQQRLKPSERRMWSLSELIDPYNEDMEN